jgi:NAD(P)-dependent dehydrogenase (short-subunit alcohol dehydrogenase family)
LTRIVVVTGGASGPGEAIVHHFAAGGDLVVVADGDELRGRQVADNLNAAGLLAESETVDVTSEGEVAAMFDAIAERHGRLDALVCSAGIDPRAAAVDYTDGSWLRALDVNLNGSRLCCKHGIPAIADTGGGAVVLLGSSAEATTDPGRAAYAASKGALAELAQQAAFDYAAAGVRVNVVSAPTADADAYPRVAATVGHLCSSGAHHISGEVVPFA